MKNDKVANSKLARIDRELASLAARQAALFAERAEVYAGVSEEETARTPAPVSSIARRRADDALQRLRSNGRGRL